MKSQYSSFRPAAEELRKDGKSFRDIRKELGIPLSTLSGWLKNVPMSDEKKSALITRWKHLNVESQIKASERHREMKLERIAGMQASVNTEFDFVLQKPNLQTLEIALAMLYLGEGTKRKCELGLGNSDPLVIQFYLSALEKLYAISRNDLRVELHLRMDQDKTELIEFWSGITSMPIEKFKYVLRDKRAAGKATYARYKGVCYIAGVGVEIQRRLVYLAEVFCKETSAVSSLGRASD